MTPKDQSAAARTIAALAPIIPVLVIEDAAHARPLAEALVAGGLPALEVTLRTPCALEAIRAMASVPGGVVGAGTLLTPEDVAAAKAAGARFGVSPGATPRLIAACIAHDLPLRCRGRRPRGTEVYDAISEQGLRTISKVLPPPRPRAGAARALKGHSGRRFPQEWGLFWPDRWGAGPCGMPVPYLFALAPMVLCAGRPLRGVLPPASAVGGERTGPR